jgi:hypothetical protein
MIISRELPMNAIFKKEFIRWIIKETGKIFNEKNSLRFLFDVFLNFNPSVNNSVQLLMVNVLKVVQVGEQMAQTLLEFIQ